MSLYTNTEEFGSNLRPIIASELKEAHSAIIATAYVSFDIIEAFAPAIRKMINKGGSFNLIIGMAFFEGINKRTLTKLTELHDWITGQGTSVSGVKLVWSRRFHGKVYQFAHNNENRIYLGSSNFSQAGLSANLESNALVNDKKTASQIMKFLKWLSESKQSVYLDSVEHLIITDSPNFRKDILNAKLSSIEAGQYDVSTLSPTQYEKVVIDLGRIAKQKKSCLNAYFGKGRWQRATGKMVPRNWFEVEIIVDQETTKSPIYPKGEFTVVTDDGYVFDCETQSPSNNYKNLRSKGDLKIFGKWIKMKLQNAGALTPLTFVTEETFKHYGKDYITLYKIGDKKYLMEF